MKAKKSLITLLCLWGMVSLQAQAPSLTIMPMLNAPVLAAGEVELTNTGNLILYGGIPSTTYIGTEGGTAVWDKDAGKLTLTDFKFSSSSVTSSTPYLVCIGAGMSKVTVEVNGDCSITSTYTGGDETMSVVKALCSLEFTGTGSLTVTGSDLTGAKGAYGLYMYEDDITLTVSGPTVAFHAGSNTTLSNTIPSYGVYIKTAPVINSGGKIIASAAFRVWRSTSAGQPTGVVVKGTANRDGSGELTENLVWSSTLYRVGASDGDPVLYLEMTAESGGATTTITDGGKLTFNGTTLAAESPENTNLNDLKAADGLQPDGISATWNIIGSTLYLNNFEYETASSNVLAIAANTTATINLSGTNSVSVKDQYANSDYSATQGIMLNSGANITIEGYGKLTATSGINASAYLGVGLQVSGSLTINSGELEVIGRGTTGMSTSIPIRGLSCSGTITMNGGKIIAWANADAGISTAIYKGSSAIFDANVIGGANSSADSTLYYNNNYYRLTDATDGTVAIYAEITPASGSDTSAPASGITFTTGTSVTYTEADGGTAVWDKDTNTLTLANFKYTSTGATALTLPDGAIIELVGSNEIAAGGGTGIYSTGAITMQSSDGAGTLTANGGDVSGGNRSYGIKCGHLTIESGSVTANGGNGNNGSEESYGVHATQLTVSGGTLTASAGTTDVNASCGIYDCANGITVTGTGKVIAIANTAAVYSFSSTAPDVTAIGGATTAAGSDELVWFEIDTSKFFLALASDPSFATIAKYAELTAAGGGSTTEPTALMTAIQAISGLNATWNDATGTVTVTGTATTTATLTLDIPDDITVVWAAELTGNGADLVTAVEIKGGGTFEMTGGKIINNSTKSGDGNINAVSVAGSIDFAMTGGEITNNNNQSRITYGIYDGGTGALDISGGTVNGGGGTGQSYALETRFSAVTISGDAVLNGGSGNNSYGVALNGNGGTITMTGGIVNGGNSSNISRAVYITDSNPAGNDVNITGGAINGGSGSSSYGITHNGKAAVTVSGTAVVNGGSGLIASEGLRNGNTGSITVSGTASVNGGSGSQSRGIYNNSTGAVTVSGGTVDGGTGTSANNGIYNVSTGKITVSGTAKINSTKQGIYNHSAGAIEVTRGTITGGTFGIYGNGNCSVTVSNAEIIGLGNAGIGFSTSALSSTISLSGNTVVFGKHATNAVTNVTPAINDNAVIITWTGNATSYDKDATTDLIVEPGDATAKWDIVSGKSGVTYTKDDNTGFIEVSGVTVNAAPVLNSDATLKSLTVSAGTLTPVFSSSITEYSVEVEYAVAEITITATKNNTGATVSGDTETQSLDEGVNSFNIVVTAEDGTTTKTYTVNITRATNPVGIDKVNPDAGIQIYSNPVTDHFQVKGITRPAVVSVYTLKGKMVLQRKIQTEESIYISSFPRGIYLINVSGKTFRIVKE